MFFINNNYFMEGDLMTLGFILFIIGLFIKNKKWKKILVYGGLALFLIILVVFFDEIKADAIKPYNVGYQQYRND